MSPGSGTVRALAQARPKQARPKQAQPLSSGRALLEGTYRSLLPTALAHGITTETAAATTLAAIDRDANGFPDRAVLWPLLIGAWKRKEPRG